ncbi:MAG: hypothetical protein Q9201_001526, partial [Fulgogasparrea decipioides]
MDVSQAASQLLSDELCLQDLPSEIVQILRTGSNAQYLDTLAHLALSPSRAGKIMTTHHFLMVELCSRWLSGPNPSSDVVDKLAALARILPVAPYLSPYVKKLLQLQKEGPLAALYFQKLSEVSEISEASLQAILLALCRLLHFDNETFADLVSPARFQLLLSHPSRPIRYLAIRVLCLYLHASDFAMQEIVGKYLGAEAINGQWEDKMIDYTFFSLWETKRLKDLREYLELARRERTSAAGPFEVHRVIRYEDLSPTTVCMSDVLLPCLESRTNTPSSLVMTPTVKGNMRSLASAIKSNRPVLLTGSLGAGKTSLIRDAAKGLGCNETMLVFHLNEQVDAKLLIGMYMTAGGSGSFNWQPGILTKAVTEGRWVMIEDYDRAPAEIITMILPLLERGELLVPHWGTAIRAAPGFKMIATLRSTRDDGDEVLPKKAVPGARHWEEVHIRRPADEELGEIVTQRFPLLHAYVPRLLGLYSRLGGSNNRSASQGMSTGAKGRSNGLQELFRWCSRVNDILQRAGVRSGQEPIFETTNESIFLEAVDCFAGNHPNDNTKEQLTNIIARELHVSRERVSFCLDARKPEYAMTNEALRIGRSTLPRKMLRTSGGRPRNQKLSPFATTNQVLRHLESIGVTIKMAEPCLLVGETGTGKTTMVQQLAETLGRKLVVVNLSQQSEAGDLLGGFKPVSMRTIAVPMKDEFSDLFECTFSSKKNQRYIEHVAKAISKNRWSRALTLWQEATKMIESTFRAQQPDVQGVEGEPSSKKRRLDSPRLQMLKKRWADFADKLNTFQKHLESGSKGFAFSFVEGNIVKAVRNGDWVLLDEINLAAPDTLESVADLLSHGNDGGPSLLLTETGETERIQAHKDFRIFAAMNPATDVGKRDLLPGLRSRFTEIFIEPPDRDLGNLIPLIQAYLGNYNHSDGRLASDVAHLYLEIQHLAHANQVVDGTDQEPHFSLRTLTRTLVYALDIAPIYGLRRALYEGFSMSFLTSLNSASCSRTVPLMENYLLSNQKNCRVLLFQTPKRPEHPERFIQFKQYWMAKGPSPVQNQAHYIITPFVESNLLNLVRATSTRRFPVLLQGPTSSGKTSMVEFLANISGHKFVRINNHEHTDLQEYLGAYVSGPEGKLQYQEGILVQALREGSWIVLDELNLAPTDVLEALNRLLDDNRELFLPETQQIVRPHENFMLFATQNPPGIYGGRKVLSRAFRSRFLELHFDDIPEDELEVILRERSQIAPSFCAKIVMVYKRLALHRQQSRLFERKNSFATLRDLFRWALRDADDREQLAINGYYLLAERVRNDDERQVVKQTIEEVMKINIDVNAIYGSHKLPAQLDLGSAATGIVWTKSMRRLYVLVTEALKSREPVLLVGDTGLGKTTICQVIAPVMHNQLHMVNAHQNMEAGDLIGSQRPVRSRHSIEARLGQELQSILLDGLGLEKAGNGSLLKLVEIYKNLPKSDLEKIPSQRRQTVGECFAQLNAIFEWVDGDLVHAMKVGHHFLLDEISLADDSVLERLNSVLEPGRKLFLAEKGVNEALVTAAEGFQFLATMNPGGEYGKKELSPALRNRFTEIWVPHASDQSELEQILEAKLGQAQAHFAKPMVAFAHWYGCYFNNSAVPVSIRDLLAWAAFLITGCVSDQCLAILHGAALVYIDTLGANPAAMLQIAGSTVKEQRQICLNKLSEVFRYDMCGAYYASVQLRHQDESFTIGPFSLQKRAAASFDPHYSLRAPTTLRNAMKIARALQLPRPILLEGSPGVGKTTLVEALAQACGMLLTRINLSDQTDLIDLFGSDVPVEGGEIGQFQWRDAPFLRAMQNGEWVLLDEMNLASQSVLEGLNACFDHRGQVYVPELDQTFNRHPDFVVFAAQNPHHQGSGRKGLPTSFVNRFSVVYADMFNAEDLLVICSEKFPNVPTDDLRLLTRCIAEFDLALQQNRRFGFDGGPWEINLRDTTRWIDLLSSRSGLLPAGTAEAYVPMLFSQRFRTAEDVSTVIALVKQHLPRLEATRLRAIGVSAGEVQVGLGLLPRHIASSFSDNQYRSLPYSHLQYVESVMLCIQQNWPCLLVGSSGSGKTRLIRHVATFVGADLVDFPMNSDMDTTELVGGYEQVDSQRESAAYMHRLECFTKEIRLQRLRSLQGGCKSLAELEDTLQGSSLKITRIVELLRKVVAEDPHMGFDGFLREGGVIIDKALEDNRARFEWVDGILVRAIIEGKWLVLDNANLCSPSVLDRLNSLLEPNGIMNITEQRSEDGSARVVKPHPGFKLFLTVDPRHGELSRAMRNRCIELFIPTSESLAHDSIDLTFDPAMVRFEQHQKVISSSVEGSISQELLWISLDHLALSDLAFIKRYSKQISAGICRLPSEYSRSFPSIAQHFDKLWNSGESIVQCIKDVYRSVSLQLGLPPGFEDIQTIQPLNNPVLPVLASWVNPSNDLTQLGLSLDFLLSILRFEDRLTSLVDSCADLAPSQLSQFQRSIMSSSKGRFNDNSTRLVAAFVIENVRILRLAVEQVTCAIHATVQRGSAQPTQPTTLLILRKYFFYLVDLFDIADMAEFDEVMFQVYLRLGKSIVPELQSQVATEQLADSLREGLDTFNPLWQLRSGQSMDLMWNHLRPPSPTTFPQLERDIKIEKLTEKFDALTWASNVLLQQLSQLRQSIAQMGVGMEFSAEFDGNDLEGIAASLQNLEASQDNLAIRRKPYLQQEFKALLQYQAASIDAGDACEKDFVGLFAGEPTKDFSVGQCPSLLGWRKFSFITRITGIDNQDAMLVTLRNTFPLSMLEKMQSITEVPLKCLELLQEEVTHMATHTANLTATLSGDHRSTMLGFLKDLHLQMAIAHEGYLEADGLVDNPRLLESDLGASIWKLQDELPSSHYLQSIVEEYLQPSWAIIARPSDQYSLRETASAWVLFFIGCLKLYVPDRLYDPALKPLVLRGRHRKRTKELQTKLSALRQYERLTTGQSPNLRCQLLENELNALGEEPAVHSVLRPRRSELSQLQGEFSNILQSITNRSPDQMTLARILSGDMSAMHEMRLLRSNINQAVARLRSSFRAYDDITKPLVAMLHGLDAGLAMAQIAAAPIDSPTAVMEHICRSTPFFKMRPTFLDQESHNRPRIIHELSYDSRLKYIQAFPTTESMTRDTDRAPLTTLFKSFQGLYEEWKQQLGEDQRKDLARSSMYRYRGKADPDAEDKEAFHEIFPDYEAEANKPVIKGSLQLKPREMAQRLAQYQRDLFEPSQSRADRIQGLMRSSASDLARLWQSSPSASDSPLAVRDLLCGLILKLDENVERLKPVPQKPMLYNFYADANLPEAQKLISIARRLQARFLRLKEAWPDHATLDDVLRICSELLDLRHTEPVARLITKVEQLQGYVYEWQKVSSRQYSAADLYEQLTSLIVGWRQLELVTWSRLFDMEDRRCEEEVDSWWFVVYETIVAAPLSILECGENLQKHAKELFATLQEFLYQSSVGHFSLRIRMLQIFKEYSGWIRQTLPEYTVVYNTLSNFLEFYSRFASPVHETWRTGRLALEKEIKDVLLLASWKDTNINALRDSAKRSHHKLFKLVRKYRVLLAQPVQQTIAQGFPEQAHSSSVSLVVLRAYVHHPNTYALQACQHVAAWSERPTRFRNISSTISNMLPMGQMHSSTSDIPVFLSRYVEDLQEDITSLQKETPPTATGDNAELLKHLTARKRKLFSDTLKDIRHMGFRSNLSADVLSRQSSLALILTQVGPIDLAVLPDNVQSLEYNLHSFFSLMTAVREASRAHSEDLNGLEVTRSIGYLESLLSYAVRQRLVVGDLTSSLGMLGRIVQNMRNVWRPGSYEVLRQTAADNIHYNFKRTVSRLPDIIDTGCVIIEKQGKLGKMDHTNILTNLQGWSRRIRTAAAAFNDEPSLPDQLISSQHRSNGAQAQLLLENLSDRLRQLTKEHPGLEFVLQQIQLWAETSPEPANEYHVNHASLQLLEYDQELLKLCDLVLVAIQAFEKAKPAEFSPKDKGWLVDSEKSLADGIKALHVGRISISLDATMAKLCQLSPQDLPKAFALTATVIPIINHYQDICHNVLNYTLVKSQALNKMAATLAKSLVQIASQGFCNPSKSGAAETGKNEKLEEGTGLGEGEGAENISKDIQDDEDLSELAQGGPKSREGEEIADQKDAVNMDQEDLEGEMESNQEKDENKEEASQAGSGEEDIDEQRGDVDDLDPNAIDEKFWDANGKEAGREKEGSKAKSSGEKDDQTHSGIDEKSSDEGQGNQEELSEAGAEEGEEVAQQEMGKMDPHAQQEENLDLPDEMDLDGQEKSATNSNLDDSDLDGLSDVAVEVEEQNDRAESEVEKGGEAESEEDRATQNDQTGREVEDTEEDRADEAASSADTEPERDAEADEGLLQTHSDDAAVDQDNIAPSDARGLNGQDADQQHADTHMQESNASGDTGEASEQTSAARQQAAAKESELGNLQEQSNQAMESRDATNEDYTSQAFKKLGDALEKWHRQQRKIQDARSSPGLQQDTTEIDMVDSEFQHLQNEDRKADTQALGAATEDQANALDQRALDSEMPDQPQDCLPDPSEGDQDKNTAMEGSDPQELVTGSRHEQLKPST